MKVKKTTGSNSKTTSELDLFEGRTVPRGTRREIKQRVGEFLVEETLSKLADATSPIAGNVYKKSLSSEYRKEKKADNLPGIANLENSGQLLDSLTFKQTKDGIEIGHFTDQAAIADGHNNFSGESDLPLRQYLPSQDNTYKQTVRREIDDIIADVIGDRASLSEAKLSRVETKTELYDLLGELFADLTRSQMRAAVFRSPNLVEQLEAFDLLRFLSGS